jgi:hypothetical protein
MNRLDERELQLHLTILGWLHIIGSSLFLILAALGAVVMPALGAVAGDAEGTAVLAVLGTAFGVLMLVVGLPGFLAGYGLLKRKSWARMLALVLAILNLVNFPIGTAIAIYTFLVLLQQSATDYFATSQRA